MGKVLYLLLVFVGTIDREIGILSGDLLDTKR